MPALKDIKPIYLFYPWLNYDMPAPMAPLTYGHYLTLDQHRTLLSKVETHFTPYQVKKISLSDFEPHNVKNSALLLDSLQTWDPYFIITVCDARVYPYYTILQNMAAHLNIKCLTHWQALNTRQPLRFTDFVYGVDIES